MFDSTAFVADLADQIVFHLREKANDFKANRLGAIALDAHPWHRGILLSILIETDKHRKWDIGDWEHQYFADVENTPPIQQGYDGLKDETADGSARYALFFRCCAQALCHQEVTEALKHYNLEPDFEPFVGDPDDPNDVNFCEEIIGVNKSRRKANTEIVNNLDEALKDAGSVLVLKYWYRHRFTTTDGERIAQLTNLQILHLEAMGLASLPVCVLSLKKLVELYLDYNQVTRLVGLEVMKSLELLSLRDNGVMALEMQETISDAVWLRRLQVGNCGLTKVPDSWQRLDRLEEILLFGNPLTVIPDWLPALPNLKRLGLVDVVDEQTKNWLRNRNPHIEIW